MNKFMANMGKITKLGQINIKEWFD